MLLAGIINFINIYLVVMLRRGKEYGLKKVFGARGKELFLNIWTENALLVSAAMLIAWLFVEVSTVPVKKKEVLEFLRKTELKIYGSEDFEYSILEEDVKAIYAQDRQTSIIYSVFACIAIIIVGLGLFGISLFDIRQRYREIAIRKVNGAQLRNLYAVLFRKYIWVIGIAILITIPLSYYLIYIYTQDFVVKAPVSIFIYAIAILIVSGISLGTLFWQVNKAARINPAEIMKSE